MPSNKRLPLLDGLIAHFHRFVCVFTCYKQIHLETTCRVSHAYELSNELFLFLTLFFSITFGLIQTLE